MHLKDRGEAMDENYENAHGVCEVVWPSRSRFEILSFVALTSSGELLAYCLTPQQRKCAFMSAFTCPYQSTLLWSIIMDYHASKQQQDLFKVARNLSI
jgi:hypothetical protein